MSYSRFAVAGKRAEESEFPPTQEGLDDGESDSSSDEASDDEQAFVAKKPKSTSAKGKKQSTTSSSKSGKQLPTTTKKPLANTSSSQRVSAKKAANSKNAESDGEEGDQEEDDVSTRSVASRDSSGTKPDTGKYAGGGNINIRKPNTTTPKEPKVAAKPVAQAKNREVVAAVETTANDLIPEDVQPTEVLPHTPSS
jgi:hypothetical protein